MQALARFTALRRGKAALKAALAQPEHLDLARLPWNEAAIDLVLAARRRGRPVYLATASDRRLAEAVAAHLGLFDGVLASDGTINLAGERKAAALEHAFGIGGFDYAGDADVDWPVWERARQVIVVNASPGLSRRVRARWPDASVLGRRQHEPRRYLKAIRTHQWLKNLLVFVPALGGHLFSQAALVAGLLAFVSFSLCASSVYVLNDIIDLKRDRAHETKRNRPFAAGTIPVLHGLLLVPLLLAAALALTVFLPAKFAGVLALYYGLTLGYTLVLKRKMMVDVVALACLYGLRIIAGGAACGIAVSAWLGTFSIFFFAFLALVKRCTELGQRSALGRGDPAGRGYRIADLPMLEGLCAASGFTAILVFALYLNSDAVATLYDHPKWLTGVCVVLVYWIGRILLLTHRGEMHDDPVVFASTDRNSQVCGLVCLSVLLTSAI